MFERNPYELSELLSIVVFSILLSLCIIIPIIVWRLIRRKPVVPKGKKLKSPIMLYAGITFFGGFAVVSFIINRPYYGSAFSIFMAAYVIGLLAYRKGWRG
jgi:glucan phosphoethanolaminetransferase (alkaline phosphatase superfamily)